MNRLLTTFVVGLAGIQGVTLAGESRPKLVVGIMVDQLRTDYLEDLKDMLGPGGFRRLMDKGVFIPEVDYGISDGDIASSTAIIQTGTFPRYNGVTGQNVYDPAIKGMKPVFTDPSYIGNFTNETYSPMALRVSTITDELSIENEGKSRIHSISPDASSAIILAGHTGSSAFWVNEETGKWASTTFYPNAPATLQNINYNSPLVNRLDTMKWSPLRSGEPYPYISSKDIKDGFKYTFPRSDREVFYYYKKSPYINSDIATAASEYVTDLGLGKTPEVTDVLNLGFSLAPFPLAKDADYRYELEDEYLRLDKDLERLFNTLDRQVGKDNVLVYLVSSGYFTEPSLDSGKYKLPGGTFSVKRASSLLNAYLSARYGNGAYIDHYSGNQFYLSSSLIEEKNLDRQRLTLEARDFLSKMSGVSDVYTATELMYPSVDEMKWKWLSMDPKTSGDLFLEFTPGWTVIDDTRYPNITKENKTTAYRTPAFLMGPGISPRKIEGKVEATAIAPTVAGLLKIRPPNSSKSKGITL